MARVRQAPVLPGLGDGRADLLSNQRTTGTWDTYHTATGSSTTAAFGVDGDLV